jgi:hypothetical protein
MSCSLLIGFTPNNTFVVDAVNCIYALCSKSVLVSFGNTACVGLFPTHRFITHAFLAPS